MGIRFLTSGESHGKCLNAIIEGLPAGFDIDFDFVNAELASRQKGYGRGGRMAIETDKIEVLSGIRHGKTMGSPVCLQIKNKDFENWKIPMSSEAVDTELYADVLREKEITIPRPGHADFAGAYKYNTDDIRNILERSSARETATRVAVGAIARCVLSQFNIVGEFEILSIGGECNPDKFNPTIDKAREAGVTLGGEIKVVFKNLPVGLGSHVHWDRRLDGLIAQAIMSIPAIKSVEIGMGRDVANHSGDNVHDEMYYDTKCTRNTNNAGGLEGGMTNGEDLVIKCAMKPIPTMISPLNSYDIKTKEPKKAHFERSDTCAVEARGVVAVNMVGIVLLNAFLERFGSDNSEQIRKNYENCK